MTAPAVTSPPAGHRVPPRLLAAVAGVAAAWFAAYQLNEPVWDWLVYDLARLRRGDRLAETVHFFGYDTGKILLLLVGIIFVVTVLRSYMSVERTRALLSGRR